MKGCMQNLCAGISSSTGEDGLLREENAHMAETLSVTTLWKNVALSSEVNRLQFS